GLRPDGARLRALLLLRRQLLDDDSSSGSPCENGGAPRAVIHPVPILPRARNTSMGVRVSAWVDLPARDRMTAAGVRLLAGRRSIFAVRPEPGARAPSRNSGLSRCR